MKKLILGGIALLLFCGISGELIAQQKQNLAGDFKQAVITYAKDLIVVINKVKSAKDVEAAKPGIQKSANNLMAVCNKILTGLDTMTPEATQALDESLIEAFQDAELMDCTTKVDSAEQKLLTDYPAASARLDEVIGEINEEIEEVLTQILERLHPVEFDEELDQGEWEEDPVEY